MVSPATNKKMMVIEMNYRICFMGMRPRQKAIRSCPASPQYLEPNGFGSCPSSRSYKLGHATVMLTPERVCSHLQQLLLLPSSSQT